MEAAEARCRREEEEISDAETLDSEYETTSTEEEDCYESDFIDDSDVVPRVFLHETDGEAYTGAMPRRSLWLADFYEANRHADTEIGTIGRTLPRAQFRRASQRDR